MKTYYFISSTFISKWFKYTISIRKTFTFSKTRDLNSYRSTKKKCYLVNAKYAHLIVNAHKFASRNWFKQIMKMSVFAMIIDATIAINYEDLYNANAINFVAHEVNAINSSINSSNSTASSVNVSLKKILSTNITIYDDIDTRIKFANVIANYSNLWNDNEFIVRISSNEWMSIEIKSNVKIETTKMYSLNLADKKFVDETFDKLHAQKRMKYISQFTLHDYSIFAIWRIVFDFDDSKRKKRVIVNIRDFNKIIFIDSYFMSLQANIIVVVVNYRFISIFNVVDFFHQW